MSSQEITPQFLAQKAWDLYQSHGVPIELSEDIVTEKGFEIDKETLNTLIEAHQKKSQQASSGQFKSGLGEDTAKTRRLHSVTHILHAILRKELGEDTKQMGSAITSEKARFDFSATESLTPEQLENIRMQVQQVIDKKLHMSPKEMTEKEARELGAIGLFGEKYGEKVTVYTMEDEQGTVFSREFCGGPHITNSSEIGTFTIIKQKSVGQGVKRIEFNVE